MARRFEASYEATPSTVGLVRDRVAALARQCGIDDTGVGDVRLAVSEAATNALVHGCREPGRTCRIHVEAEAVGDELHVDIADEGIGMRPRTDSPGLGLGLSLMAMVALRMEIVEGDPGTCIRMTFPCPQAG
jgi:anti-sigma regulatory factor (Ser/Thr protein kinase)